uniref:Uncharacterized protein n=1 Tax=Siphoviridae sp. ctedO8 TaxID=2827907 RepID=A0A8S5T3U7_9CAUD|nr:MAG TPA: hypothetical protein [Siphoviridae sp. ctedO8]
MSLAESCSSNSFFLALISSKRDFGIQPFSSSLKTRSIAADYSSVSPRSLNWFLSIIKPHLSSSFVTQFCLVC